MSAYYNEIDPAAAAWLRELVKAGHIAPGDVDERSIEDVRPDDLLGYTQCHFFAGIGGWSLALRLAGWPDDRPIWTGSCPCQPFSAAGKGKGADDERHLWPAFHWLIAQCSPPVVAGEQVASKAANEWLDIVSTDLEALGFAVGAVAFPAAGLGAPHIRDRAYWVADASGVRGPTGLPTAPGRHERQPNIPDDRSGELSSAEQRQETGRLGPEGLANSSQRRRREERQNTGGLDAGSRAQGRPAGHMPGGAIGGMANGHSDRRDQTGGDQPAPRDDGPLGNGGAASLDRGTGPTNGFWGAADWLHCRDGKWRPVEPGTFPLVDGIPRGVVPSGDISLPSAEGRQVRLKGYGNAIVPQQAAEFMKATGLFEVAQ